MPKLLSPEVREVLKRKRLTLVLGIALGAYFLLKSVEGLDLKTVIWELRLLRWDIVVICAFIVLISIMLRAFRWGLIMSPWMRLRYKSLASMTWVGSLAITVLPVRSGEVVRPYLLSRRYNVSLVDAFATIVVERVLDMVSILLLSGVLVWEFSLPGWLVRRLSDVVILIGVALTVIAVCAWFVHRRRDLSRVFARLQEWFEEVIASFARLRGERLFSRWMGLIALSFLQWLPALLLIYFLSYAFPFHLSLFSAFFVMIFILISFMIPGPPGSVGNYHFFALLALSLVGIPREMSFGYVTVLYSIQTLVVLVVGGAYAGMESIPSCRTRLHDNALSTNEVLAPPHQPIK